MCLSDGPGLCLWHWGSGSATERRIVKKTKTAREVFGSRWSRDPTVEAPAGGAVAHGGAFSNEFAIDPTPFE